MSFDKEAQVTKLVAVWWGCTLALSRHQNNLEGDSLAGMSCTLSRGFFILVFVAIVPSTLVLLAADPGLAQPVLASWCGPGFEGTTTASGEPFDASDYTAASPTLPFGRS
jgi:hypothetical protein